MSKLTKKQLTVIADLFESGGNEAEVLSRHKISRKLWNRWLNNENFNGEISTRLASSHRQSRILLAKYIPLAAAKLVQLCDSDKEETSRKACLDILSLQNSPSSKKDANDETADTPQTTLDPAIASKLLKALANE